MSTRYGLDDLYQVDPTLAFNYATYTFSSTCASLKDRYQADSCLKTNSPEFAAKIVDRFTSLNVLDHAPFELFFVYYSNKIHRKVAEMISKKQINTIKDLHDNDFSNICSFFVKQQFKFNVAEKLKAPQGIIAWSKAKVMVNIIFMKYMEYVLVNTKKFNIPSLQKPVTNETYARLNFVPENRSFGSDVSGYDKTQNATSLHVERIFVQRHVGPMLTQLHLLYFKHRASYVVVNEFINQLVEFIKCSGEPGTLIMNTLWKILSTHYFLDIDYNSRGLVLFQGDDDLVNKPYSFNRERYDELRRYVDFELKIEEGFYPEFAGKFYTRLGPIRDLWRNACRAYARSQNLTFREQLDRPVNHRFSAFEMNALGLNSNMTLRQAIRVSYLDMLSDLSEAKIAVLDDFYYEHLGLQGIGSLAFDTINYYVDDYACYRNPKLVLLSN
jgi:hypothetical protein